MQCVREGKKEWRSLAREGVRCSASFLALDKPPSDRRAHSSMMAHGSTVEEDYDRGPHVPPLKGILSFFVRLPRLKSLLSALSLRAQRKDRGSIVRGPSLPVPPAHVEL